MPISKSETQIDKLREEYQKQMRDFTNELHELRSEVKENLIAKSSNATKLDDINSQLREITHLLTGNGNPDKGIIVRLDRLEQNESRRVWLLRTAIAASIAAIATAFKGYFQIKQ